jgi:hypothetical protein
MNSKNWLRPPDAESIVEFVTAKGFDTPGAKPLLTLPLN